jgi:F1F0 ATPase subunit 2
MMPAPLEFVLALSTGFCLGILFFGGLWMTVLAIPKSRHPVVIAVASFWVRTAVVIAGLLLAMDSLWQRALACLMGFIFARILLSRWIPGNNPSGRGAI